MSVHVQNSAVMRNAASVAQLSADSSLAEEPFHVHATMQPRPSPP